MKKKARKPEGNARAGTGNSDTGIPELDQALGGGFPKGSVVLLAGSPGCGKTILSFQWLFQGASKGENGLYISMTEPLFKSLKNLEGMGFYDRAAVEDERLKVLDMREMQMDGGFDYKRVLDFIEKNVEETGARRLCIDSVTAIAYSIDDKAKIRHFLFELGKMLASLGCTSILTSEVTAGNGGVSVYGVEEFISDAIVKLDQDMEKGGLQRMARVLKLRGRELYSDEIFFRITGAGISALPRLDYSLDFASPSDRVSTGNEVLDGMMGGGVFRTSSSLVTGPPGSGKSLLSMQFLVEGLKRGEACVYVAFDENREQIIKSAQSVGWDLQKYEKSGLLSFRCAYPLQMTLNEHLVDIRRIIERSGAKRVAVDSFTSFTSIFTEEEVLLFAKRLHGHIKHAQVTGFYSGLPQMAESPLAARLDNVIMLRHVELEGELKLVLNILKARGTVHNKSLRELRITDYGIVVGQPLSGYEGIVTGVTRKVSKSMDEMLEAEFLRALGPMGKQAYEELSARGMNEESVSSYVKAITKDGIMSEEDAESFGGRILAILRKEGPAPPRADEKSAGKKKEGFLERLMGED